MTGGKCVFNCNDVLTADSMTGRVSVIYFVWQTVNVTVGASTLYPIYMQPVLHLHIYWCYKSPSLRLLLFLLCMLPTQPTTTWSKQIHDSHILLTCIYVSLIYHLNVGTVKGKCSIHFLVECFKLRVLKWCACCRVMIDGFRHYHWPNKLHFFNGFTAMKLLINLQTLLTLCCRKRGVLCHLFICGPSLAGMRH